MGTNRQKGDAMMGQGAISSERRARVRARAIWRGFVLLTVSAGLSGIATAQQDRPKSPGEIVLSSDMTLEEIERAIKHFRSLRGLPQFRYVEKRDYHPNPLRKVVVLGESHVATRNGWVTMFGELLRDAQGTERLEVINAGIGGNAISTRSPGYAASAKPSAMERFREDVIAKKPDLVIISYGLNDMRAGMALEAFREDLSHIVGEVRKAVDPVIVLTTVYNMSAYELYPPFDKGSVEATEVYNSVIRRVAEEHDALVADIWHAEGHAPWLISLDTVHANRLGHRVIAHRVFQTVVTNCSGAAQAVKPTPSDVRAELEHRHQAAVDRVIKRLEAMQNEKAN